MKNLLGNSCAKGCLVYVVALVAIIAVTSLGLGGLKGRFNTEQPIGAAITTDGQQVQPGDGMGGGILPTPTSALVLPPPVQERPAEPTIVILPTQPPGSTGPGTTVQFTPVPGQGGVISGEASPPFYVVQSGDTLSEIALRFGVHVDTILRINNLTSDVIQPGQVIYLPQPQSPGQPQPAPTFAVILPGNPGAQPTPLIPSMPNTGIIKR